MPEVLVRRLGGPEPRDEALALAARAAEADGFCVPLEPLETPTRDDGSGVLVAEYSNTVIGVAAIALGAPPDGPAWYRRGDVAALRSLAVEPAMRGLGVASALLASAEAHARDYGAAHLAVEADASQGVLIDLLGRRGFVAVDHARHADRAFVVLSKPLAGVGLRAA